MRLGASEITIGQDIFESGGIYWVARQIHAEGGIFCVSNGGYYQLGSGQSKRLPSHTEIEIIGSFHHYPPTIKPKNMLIYNLMLKAIAQEGLRISSVLEMSGGQPLWSSSSIGAIRITTKIPVFAYIIINSRTHIDLYADHFILSHGVLSSCRSANATKVHYADPSMMTKIRNADLAAQAEQEAASCTSQS